MFYLYDYCSCDIYYTIFHMLKTTMHLLKSNDLCKGTLCTIIYNIIMILTFTFDKIPNLMSHLRYNSIQNVACNGISASLFLVRLLLLCLFRHSN